MSVTVVASRESLIVKEDRESVINLNGADENIRWLAITLCISLKTHPEYALTEKEHTYIAIILGETSSLADKIIEGTTNLKNVYDHYRLSLEKCAKLSQLIHEHPFIIIARDEDCQSYTFKTLICHPVSIDLDREISIVSSDQLAVIRARSIKKILRIQVVANCGIGYLKDRLKYYEELPEKTSNLYFALSCVPTVLGGITTVACLPVYDICPDGMLVGSIALAAIGAIAVSASMWRCCNHHKC